MKEISKNEEFMILCSCSYKEGDPDIIRFAWEEDRFCPICKSRLVKSERIGFDYFCKSCFVEKLHHANGCVEY